jgi:uncharacterized membrane protein YciS (DUF1049 family)
MDFYSEIMQEPKWYRWVDSVVILIIGMVLGIVIANIFFINKVTVTQTIRRVPLQQEQQVPHTIDNKKRIRFEEV